MRTGHGSAATAALTELEAAGGLPVPSCSPPYIPWLRHPL